MTRGFSKKTMLTDKFGRQITDLRVSVTDRCNFRCIYCRASEPENYQPPEHLLSWPELERLCGILGRLGLRKIRVTGGEPLVRPGVEEFIARLAALGLYDDIAITTNGYTLAEKAPTLKAAGLNRVNVSLDSLRPERFDRITRTRGALKRVLAGIEAAQAGGLDPVKVNAVIVRGFNDDEISDFARFARHRGLVMRFIEFMPLDADHIWDRTRVVPAAEMRRGLEAAGLPLEELPRHYASETALRYRFADGGPGEIGLVAPVSEPFCGKCSRIRLTADGKIRTCLFSQFDHDLRGLLRAGAPESEVTAEVERIVEMKEDGHHINDPDFVPPNRTMVFIGG
ncbi:MAG: GTP 3',8-cyclase MoaA [Acidobacteria bacterium]|nr:GTP 3',8-cyclase MoaA [Acidobacteriota bacterium]